MDSLMRVSLGAPTPINAFDLNAAALIYQSKAADSKPCLLRGRLHNTVSDERFPLDKKKIISLMLMLPILT